MALESGITEVIILAFLILDFRILKLFSNALCLFVCYFGTVPHEIRARGIEAELAYKSALMEGEVQVCRARLLIIGQDRAGKTSLKKSLLGLPFHPNEPSTEGLEVNPSRFEVSVEQVIHWKPVVDEERDGTQVQERNIAKLVAERLERIKVANTTVQGRIEEDEEKSANTHVCQIVVLIAKGKKRYRTSFIGSRVRAFLATI